MLRSNYVYFLLAILSYILLMLPFELLSSKSLNIFLIVVSACGLYLKYNFDSKYRCYLGIFLTLVSFVLVVLNVLSYFFDGINRYDWLIYFDGSIFFLSFGIILLCFFRKKVQVFLALALAFLVFSSSLIFIFAELLEIGINYSIWISSYRSSFDENLVFLLLSSYVIYEESRDCFITNILYLVISPLLLIMGQIFDLLSPLGIAGGVAYLPFILSSLCYRRFNISYVFAISATLLTILGFFISVDQGVGYDKVITNRILAIMAIWATAIVTNIQRLTYEKSKDSEENFVLAFKYSAVGVALVSPEGKWLKVNDALCDIVGYSEEELLEIDFQTITHEDDLDLDLSCVKQVLDGEIRSYKMEKRYYHKQGHVVWILLNVALARNEDGSPRYFISQIQDITDRKEKERLLKLERDRANNASEAKSIFLATMSHEVRTPLNSIIGFSDLLKRMKLKKEVAEYVESIHSSGELLLTLINDILDFSKMEAGELKIENSEVDLSKMLNNVVEMLKDMASKNNVDVNLCVSNLVPDIIYADEIRIKQILINLLSNAIKFSKGGSALLSVILKRDGDKKVRLRFEVEDDGIGIAREMQDDIFDRFFQIDSSTTRQYGGSGLGLAIFKKLVDLMGGEMGLSSDLGKGSKFWFEFDFFVGGRKEKKDDILENILSKKLLFISQNNFEISTLKNYCEDLGVDIKIINFDRIQEEDVKKYELVIVGSDYAEEDLLNYTKNHNTNNDTKFGFISINKENKRKVKKLGCDFYLKKPLLVDVFVKTLGDLSIETKPVVENSNASKVDGKTTILIAEDNELSYQLLKDIINDIGYEVEIKHDGQQAFDELEKNHKLYKLVFMDCRMPVMNGFDATREIRNQEWGENIKIVATTANALQGDREKCLRFGMDDYLSKPVRYDDVKAVIEKYLEL